jgi:hypothetical protein
MSSSLIATTPSGRPRETEAGTRTPGADVRQQAEVPAGVERLRAQARLEAGAAEHRDEDVVQAPGEVTWEEHELVARE